MASLTTAALVIVNWCVWRNAPILPYPATLPQPATDEHSFKQVA
ncbi:MAG TPA: hypothetical protein VKS22_11890 [Candidatus Binataceae bacterium]|nr:hypothetical protein [Candidatus Binataceae bacterium]